MILKPIPSLISELIWHKMDDGLVVISPDDGRIRVFNDVGSYIWTSVDGERSMPEIASLLSRDFEVSKEQALLDVGIFLKRLDERGLISWLDKAEN